jgi:hypothetical protein
VRYSELRLFDIFFTECAKERKTAVVTIGDGRYSVFMTPVPTTAGKSTQDALPQHLPQYYYACSLE